MKALVITARGFHAGYLGCYGNDWIDTPTLDRLAAEGIVFDQHHAIEPSTAGAHRAWRSGCYALPPTTATGPLAGAGPDLLQVLRGHEIPTCLVLDGSRATQADFAPGWKKVFRVHPPGEESTALEDVLEVVGDALDYLVDQERWLLWVDLATLLPPWHVPEEFSTPYLSPQAQEEVAANEPDAEELPPLPPLPEPVIGPIAPEDEETVLRLQGSYAAAVGMLDAGLEVLREELEARGLAGDVVWIVSTDHGWPLGEHGVIGPCRPWLHDEFIHLPLILRLPDRLEAGRRVSALTQPCDLFPTLLDLFGLPPVSVHGHSLWPLVRGAVEQVRAYACSGIDAGAAVEWALRTPEFCFLLPLQAAADEPLRPPQLYLKPDDRWEVNNVLQHYPMLVEHLEKTLRGFVEATRRPGPLQPPGLPMLEENSPAAVTDELGLSRRETKP